MRAAPTVALALAAASAGGAPAERAGAGPQGRPRLLVLDFSASMGADPELAKLLANMVVARLNAIGRYELQTSADVRQLLQLEKEKQLLGCPDEKCLVEIGSTLGHDWLVAGSVSRLGDRPVLTLKLVDAAGARIARQLTETLPADESRLPEAMRVATYRLLDMPVPEEPVEWYRNPWVWAAVGAVVAGGAVGGAILVAPPGVPQTGLGTVVLDAP